MARPSCWNCKKRFFTNKPGTSAHYCSAACKDAYEGHINPEGDDSGNEMDESRLESLQSFFLFSVSLQNNKFFLNFHLCLEKMISKMFLLKTDESSDEEQEAALVLELRQQIQALTNQKTTLSAKCTVLEAKCRELKVAKEALKVEKEALRLSKLHFTRKAEKWKTKCKKAERQIIELEKRPNFDLLKTTDSCNAFTYECARRVTQYRVDFTLSLRNTCLCGSGGLNLFFKDPSSLLTAVRLPEKTTISRFQPALAAISKRLVKVMVCTTKHCAILFDGSTQFKFVNMLCVSILARVANEVKEMVLDVVNATNQKSGYECVKIMDIMEHYDINVENQVSWTCGDCCNGNTGPNGGVAVRLSNAANRSICFIKCGMHILQFSWWNSMDDILGIYILADISSVVKQMNCGRWRNQMLLNEINDIEGATLAGNPCKTRICSYAEATRNLDRYWEEMGRFCNEMFDNADPNNNVRWNTCVEFFSDPENHFLVAFINDFHQQLFLPMLSYLENAKELQEKAKIGEKLADFKLFVNSCKGELEMMINSYFEPDSGDVFINTWRTVDDLLECSGPERSEELMDMCAQVIEKFGERFFFEMKFYEEFPYIGVQLFSEIPESRKKAATHILFKVQFRHSESDLDWYYDIFDEPTALDILTSFKETGSSADWDSSLFKEELTALYECMPFTNVFSERVFSIQNYIQRSKRNITLQSLRQYMFLRMNKVDLSGDHQLEFEEERRKVRLREQGLLPEEDACDVYAECFLDEYEQIDNQYSSTIRRLVKGLPPPNVPD